MNRSETNIWRKLQDQPELTPMKSVVEHLTKYIVTYKSQPGWEEYSDELFINDILYGLGVSLSDKNQYATGFTKFKKELLTHLQNDLDTQQRKTYE